jgi:hypothetical protein
MIAPARIHALLLAGLASATASACEVVTSFPAHLSNGVYCLDSNIAIGNVTPFWINGDATLDCRGHRVRDLAIPSQSDFAVVASGDNVILKNCVFEGFSVAVFFDRATNYRVEGNTVINAGARGISATGEQGSITANRIFNTHGHSSTYVAIEVWGTADLLANTIDYLASGSTDSQLENGIASYENDGGVIASNLVRNLPDRKGIPLWVEGQSIVYRNVVTTLPGSSEYALKCRQWGGVFLQNLFAGVPYPYIQCPIIDYNG